MAIQHTQGKWSILDTEDNSPLIYCEQKAKTIAEVNPKCGAHYSITETDEVQANAQLIVDAVNNTAGKGINPNAVPGLLEALKNLLGVLGDYPDREYEDAIIAAKKATKATELK